MRSMILSMVFGAVLVGVALSSDQTALGDPAAKAISGGQVGDVCNAICTVQTNCNFWNDVFDKISNPSCQDPGSCSVCENESISQEGCQGFNPEWSCSYVDDGVCGEIFSGTCNLGTCISLTATGNDCLNVPKCETFSEACP